MTFDESLGRGTLLIVDDEADIAEELCEFLASEGYRTLLSDCVRDAWNKIQKTLEAGERIDLVISDLRMPGGSGTELMAQARSINLDAPFILVTGHGELGAAAEDDDNPYADAAAFMKKPLDIDALLDTIEALLVPA